MAGIDATSILQMRNAILQQNASLQKVAAPGSLPGAVGGPEKANPTEFTEALRGALAEVNDMQSKSSAATESYERGETTDIAAVMLAREKASLGFQATLQVRNKLLSAYKDIMSMPV